MKHRSFVVVLSVLLSVAAIFSAKADAAVMNMNEIFISVYTPEEMKNDVLIKLVPINKEMQAKQKEADYSVVLTKKEDYFYKMNLPSGKYEIGVSIINDSYENEYLVTECPELISVDEHSKNPYILDVNVSSKQKTKKVKDDTIENSDGEKAYLNKEESKSFAWKYLGISAVLFCIIIMAKKMERN